MLIPFGTGKRITIWPFVTIGLIVLNTLIWLITNSVIRKQEKHILDLENHMWLIERPYLYFDANIDLNELIGLTFEKRSQMVLDGQIMDLESDDFYEWQELYYEHDQAIKKIVFRRWGFIPAYFNPIKMLTSMFVHANILHLFGNMLFLWVVGCNLENDMGVKKYIALYLASGFGAAIIHWAAAPSSSIPTVGASGAIAGLMGAFLIRFYKTKIKCILYITLKPVHIKLPAWLFLGGWFLQQVYEAKYGGGGSVAFWAHIGGFVFGGALVIIMQAMEWLHPSDPEGDEDGSYGESMAKTVRKLENRDMVIQNPTHETLPALLSICRIEPENVEAHLSLARFQFENNLVQDSAIAFNTALDAVLSEKHNERIGTVYEEIKTRGLVSLMSKDNIYRLILNFEEMARFEDAIKLSGLYVKKFTQCPNRPKILYKMYVIFKRHLKNEMMAKKAAAYLKKEYPNMVKT